MSGHLPEICPQCTDEPVHRQLLIAAKLALGHDCRSAGCVKGNCLMLPYLKDAIAKAEGRK